MTKTLSFLLMVTICWVTFSATILAQSVQPTVDKKTEKIKAQVKKIVAGEKVTKKVKLKNGTTYRGFIESPSEDSFVVQDKTGGSNTVKYSDVESIDKKDVPTALKIGIGAGAAVVVLVLLTIFPPH